MFAVSAAHGAYLGARRVLRILRNIVTRSETARLYPDVAFRRVWNGIPASMQSTRVVRAYGQFLHRRSCERQIRRPVDSTFHTFFLRNAPHFDVLRRLVLERPHGSALRIAAMGCSSGAELYTAIWTVRCVRPDLKVTATGVDIDAAALAKAQLGIYGRDEHELSRLPDDVLERLCESAPIALFRQTGGPLAISDRLDVAPSWFLQDVRDSMLESVIGPQDIVLANNILCHMYDSEAGKSLRNIAALISPGGHLFMYGVDLDLKVRTVRSLGLLPVRDMIEEVYLADWNALAKWPFTYWGREPFDGRRPDWEVRYAAVYHRPA